MAGKHTQGDWHLSGQFDAEVSVEVVVGDVPGEEISICELVPFDDEWSEEEIANAHLIAASDKMLAALNSAFACFQRIYIQTTISGIRFRDAEGR